MQKQVLRPPGPKLATVWMEALPDEMGRRISAFQIGLCSFCHVKTDFCSVDQIDPGVRPPPAPATNNSTAASAPTAQPQQPQTQAVNATAAPGRIKNLLMSKVFPCFKSYTTWPLETSSICNRILHSFFHATAAATAGTAAVTATAQTVPAQVTVAPPVVQNGPPLAHHVVQTIPNHHTVVQNHTAGKVDVD